MAEISPPDDALLTALIVKQFVDRQLNIDADVLNYMMTRMDRSFTGVRRLITAVDEEAMVQKRAITVPLVRQVLEKL